MPPPTRSIVLEEDFRIGGDEPDGGGSGTFFGGITHVGVDDSALIYVSDWRASTIFVVDSTGAVVRTIGRSGDGPGEFRGGPGRTIVRGDSVSAFPGGLVSVFERADGAFRRQYTLPSVEQHSIGGVMRPVGNDFLVYAGGHHPPYGDGRDLLLRVNVVDDSASVIYSLPTHEPPLRGEGGSITSVPYTRGPRCATTNERIYCGYTDELLFTELSLEGDSLGALRVDFDAAPITSGERAGFAERYAGTQFEASLNVPRTWPAYYSLWGDSKGRLWIHLRYGREDTVTTMWIVDPATLTSVSTTTPGIFSPTQEVGDRLYGIHRTPTGEASVVRYVIRE